MNLLHKHLCEDCKSDWRCGSPPCAPPEAKDCGQEIPSEGELVTGMLLLCAPCSNRRLWRGQYAAQRAKGTEVPVK